MNIPVLVGVGMVFLVMIIFLIMRNKKDRKEMEEKMNNDFHKTVDKENEVDTDEAKD